MFLDLVALFCALILLGWLAFVLANIWRDRRARYALGPERDGAAAGGDEGGHPVTGLDGRGR